MIIKDYRKFFVIWMSWIIISLGVFFVAGTRLIYWTAETSVLFNPSELFVVSTIGFGWASTAIVGLYKLGKLNKGDGKNENNTK